MKVVLFCGGLGMRIRDYAEDVPKPMILVGQRPILWHVMRYYAHFGHRDFILCLGYRGDMIKDYFLRYDECVSNDFVLSGGGKQVELLNSDITDWRITFVDTGLDANIGQRLMAVRDHLAGEEQFLANYSDGLTDLPLPDYLKHFQSLDKVASLLCVRPNLSYHFVALENGGHVASIRGVRDSGLRINSGYFVLRRAIFDYMEAGEELVVEPFQRLLRAGQLGAYDYDGFWMPMDTFKDKQRLDEMYRRGETPWEVWKHNSGRR